MADPVQEPGVEKVTTVVPKAMEVVVPTSGAFTIDQWKSYVNNILNLCIPVYGFAFFGALAMGVKVQIAAVIALAALWLPLRDFFKKWNSDTPYLREK